MIYHRIDGRELEATDHVEDLAPLLGELHGFPVELAADLVDQDTRRPVGLIDFETATVGDPAVDFVGLLCTLGNQTTRQIIEAYPGSIAWDRLLFYWQVAPAYDVVYGLAQKDDGIVKDGIDGLRRRVTMKR